MPQDQEMDVIRFARLISMLETPTPVADEFDQAYPRRQTDGRWWSCQREHLTVWCLYQPTHGPKGFHRKTPNSSARTMYELFGRPETLLWLAEALGEDVRALAREVMPLPRADALKAIREAIPFDRILELMKDRKLAEKFLPDDPA